MHIKKRKKTTLKKTIHDLVSPEAKKVNTKVEAAVAESPNKGKSIPGENIIAVASGKGVGNLRLLQT
jgi:ATP-binding protein involved in chromosome partitioning